MCHREGTSPEKVGSSDTRRCITTRPRKHLSNCEVRTEEDGDQGRSKERSCHGLEKSLPYGRKKGSQNLRDPPSSKIPTRVWECKEISLEGLGRKERSTHKHST